MFRLDKIFAENVSVAKRRVRVHDRHLRGWGARITLLWILLLVAFFALIVRLFHLTIIRGYENRSLSESNRMRTAILHAPRGIFYDRRGVPLVKNIPSFRITGPCIENEPCKTSFMTDEEFRARGIDPKSVYLEPDYFREYVFPYETAHTLGYLGEISEEEVGNALYRYQDYLAGDRLGRMGLEAVFEKKLRGVDGKELIEINSQHQKIRSLGKVDPLPGVDIHLSIDSDLQRVAYMALGENSGAIVVSKPKTGEILAFVSTPSFDPNKFHKGLTATEYESLVKGSDKPLFNRALSGVYPPGSTFKIISSAAGLESGKLKKDTLIEDTGIIRIGEFSFSNWYFTQYGGTEGSVDMVKAIARSNDIYFYKLGEMVGIDSIANWGRVFGVGQKTGIELTHEAEGVMPDREYQRKVRGTDWYLGDNYHIAIGQGDLQTTPLQVNRWTSVIANGGFLCDFSLIKVQSGSTTEKKCRELQLQKATIAVITEGMRRACYNGADISYQGTGWPLFDFTVIHEEETAEGLKGTPRKVPIACKTGTAEFGDPSGKTHAWFTAFAPLVQTNSSPETISGEPEIVVTVLLEKGGEGSTNAGPVAKKILEEWFKR